ncbi:MAG: FAD-dependent oxidoreductase [Deltaproteobacteria bacterium]|jgi:nitrite reductase (NADH) large subunit|nr:FAD-dependent oxidoreductase [Deltaproteobacteria bacterium]
MNIVIAGAGIAGLSAAEAARKANPGCEVVLFSRERQRPYFRPRLPQVVSGEAAPDGIYVHPEEWYRQPGLEFRLGESLVEVNTESRFVRGSLGSRLTYDRLLIATGAVPFLPDAAGKFTLPGVFPLRTLLDASDLHHAAKVAKTAVLLGSGLLGLEVGHALTRLGLTVHVLEMSSRVLPFQTTPASSARLQKLLEAKSFVFHLEAEAERAEGAERLERVVLKSGAGINCDLMAVSAGVTAVTELASALGLKTERGIVVDQYMETTSPGVYAAGDCAQTPDRRGGMWAISRAEGLVAGRNAVSDDPASRVPYEPVAPSAVLKVAGIDLTSVGNIDPEGKLPFAEFDGENVYRKVVTSPAGQLVGFTVLGGREGVAELTRATGKKTLAPEVLEDLKGPGFDFKRLDALAS